MSGSRITVTRPLVGSWREILVEAGEVVLVGTPERCDRDRLRRELATADALVCLLTDRIDRELIEAAPRLKVIGNCAVGVDNIDVQAAFERGITICHTPGMLTNATADLTMALLLAVARRIVEADRFVREGGWTVWQPGLILGLELSGSTLGILGMGRIGQAVAQRAVAFGLKVVYWDRQPVQEAQSIPAEYLELDDLLGQSDIVCLHLPLTLETEQLMNRERLGAMKPGSILINTARGRIVDEEALVQSLRSGHLSGAGLDVYEREPEIHPGLLELKQVVLLPHIGSATHRTRTAMASAVCRDVVKVLGGQRPEHPLVV
ncbi:MAG: D-glycerate dehydrogenase [Bradymonadales bacterium]|nr:D-glycerate dehydrogenase [Bradymonadales bacterium]